MSFIWPWLLLTLLLVPLLIGLYVRLQQRRQQALQALGPFGVTPRITGFRRHGPAALFLVGIALLLFALSRPESFVSLPRVEGTVILAFDVSASMAAEDLEPSRIAAAKTAARTFVENQPDTVRIGVVAFSSGGLVVQQPTDDPVAIINAIDRLTPDGSTSLGTGIFTTLNAAAGELIAIDPEMMEEGIPTIEFGDFSSTVVVLLSDGENRSNPDPLEVAQLAAEAGLRIYPIGLGSPDGAIIELDGFTVLTQLDETPLQQIASVTNGEYYRAEDAETLQEIYENIDLQLTVAGEKMEITAIIAGLALCFFITGGALSLLWFGRVP